MSNFCNRVGWAKHSFGLLVVTLTLAAPATVTAQSQEPVDLDAIYRIKAEGFQRSQILETLEYLTDVHGPRLTGSPNARAAADYAMAKLREWGMETVKLEQFPFGRGWANDRTVALIRVHRSAMPLRRQAILAQR